MGTTCLDYCWREVYDHHDFWCHTRKAGLYVKVGFNLKSQILTLLSVPTIREPLTCHPRDASPHLSGLKFADEPEDGQELGVDILVG